MLPEIRAVLVNYRLYIPDMQLPGRGSAGNLAAAAQFQPPSLPERIRTIDPPERKQGTRIVPLEPGGRLRRRPTGPAFHPQRYRLAPLRNRRAEKALQDRRQVRRSGKWLKLHCNYNLPEG